MTMFVCTRSLVLLKHILRPTLRFQSTAPACSGSIPTIHSRCGHELHHYNYTLNQLPYSKGTEIMDGCVRKFLDSKKSASASSPPPPTLLTFQFRPVYTLGRREKGSKVDTVSLSDGGRADIFETFRGGQTTFHGPGQMVAYPIIDLRSFDSTSSVPGSTPVAHIPVRCYVSLLEQTLIQVLSQHYGIASAQTTENTGVWVDPDHKIAALGIHVRRSVTSHGIALNMSTDLRWFERIVACGLPDKKTTTVEKWTGQNAPVSEAANWFAEALATNLGLTVKTEYK